MTDPAVSHRLRLLQRIIHRMEDLIIAGLLLATMGLALYQIILRNVMGTGIVWADILIRLMVLWLGMAGAMVATRQHKHISVDLVTRYLSAGWRRAAEGLTTLFACGVCLLAGYHSLQFVIGERAFGSVAFAQVPYWVCVSILPVSLFVIALRYAVQFYLILRRGREAAS
jgi:TRAP-type C4-dicarboxylate transport system permease small subunit